MSEQTNWLKAFNLTAPQVQALNEAGFNTVESVAVATKRDLEQITGIGKVTVDRLWNKSHELMFAKEFVPGDTVAAEHEKTVKFLTTGSTALNELLGGGIETQSITEIAGANGSGKSQLCQQLCVNVQLPIEQGGFGPDAGVLFIDTEKTFRGERVRQMAEAKGLDGQQVLKHIVYAQVYNSDHQIFLLAHCDDAIKMHNVRLIIIDSLLAHFRSEYVGREQLSPRQQLLNNHIARLSRLTRVFNTCTLITNQAISDPSFLGGENPAGGNIIGHGAVTRLWIRHPSALKTRRIVRLLKSPWRPNVEVVLDINENGIVDTVSG